MRLIFSHFSCIFNPLDHSASKLNCAWNGARQAERLLDHGLLPDRSSMARLHRLGDLIDLHIADMCAIGKPRRRSKAASLVTHWHDPGADRDVNRPGNLSKAAEKARRVQTFGADPLAAPVAMIVLSMPGQRLWRGLSTDDRHNSAAPAC